MGAPLAGVCGVGRLDQRGLSEGCLYQWEPQSTSCENFRRVEKVDCAVRGCAMMLEATTLGKEWLVISASRSGSLVGHCGVSRLD